MLGPMPTDNDVGTLGRDYGEVLWRPGPELIERARITDYRRWLACDRGVALGSASSGPTAPPHRGPESTAYQELWDWSVAEPGAFWDSLWHYFDVVGERGTGPVLSGDRMPDVTWFPGATLNYAQNALRVARTDTARLAVIARDEDGGQTTFTYGELAAEVARVRAGLQALGVTRGDRVAAYLPNIPAALIGLLATASLGAIWSCCWPWTGTGTAANSSTAASRWPRSSRPCRAWRRWSWWASTVRSPGPRRKRWTLIRSPVMRPRSSSSRRCRSAIPCGFCTHPARPGCPRRSCTVTAGSSSNISRPCVSTRISAPGTCSSGTPRPAG